MSGPLSGYMKFPSGLEDIPGVLSRLLTEIPSDVFLIDEQGKYLFCNASFIDTLNLQGREIEHAIKEYIHFDQELFSQITESVIDNGETIVIPEYSVTRSDGDKRIYKITLQPFEYRINGMLKRAMLFTSVDITEQKEASALLRQHANEVELLHSVGQKISETLDLSVIYQTFLELVSRIMPHDSLFVSSYNADEGLIYCKYALIDGVEVDVGKLPPVPLEPEGQGLQSKVIRSGEPLLINDVNKYVKQLSQVHYIDENDAVYDAQETLPEDEPVTQSVLIVPLMLAGKCVGAIQVFSYEVDAFTDDNLRVLQALASQIAVASNNALLYEKAQQEIEERRKLQAELEEERNLLARRVGERTAELLAANEELQQALKIKDEFLANMSHELRTPLNAILGMRESMALGTYGPLDPRHEKPLSYIQRSGEHLLEMINDVLDLSRIQSGQTKSNPVELPLSTAVGDAIQMVDEVAKQKDIEIHFTPGDLHCIVEFDQRQFRQVLLNLLSNAIKFTDEGGKVGVYIVFNNEAGQVQVVVWDTGIGISPEDQTKLFQPFMQLDSGLNRRYEGTGLGLALSAKLVELNGGQISIESEGANGKGSRFIVTLPAKIVEASGPSDEPTMDKSDAKLPETVQNVLIVEDNPANLEMISSFVGRVGYDVCSAEDGEEAVDLSSQGKFDLILMDIQLPVMDGLEAIRRIRRGGKNMDTPIIALTALAMPGDKERCLSAGADLYVSKPVNLKALSKSMAELLA